MKADTVRGEVYETGHRFMKLSTVRGKVYESGLL